MQGTNITIIIIVAVAALALVIFLMIRNRKDKKELLPPEEMTDASVDARKDQGRREERL